MLVLSIISSRSHPLLDFPWSPSWTAIMLFSNFLLHFISLCNKKIVMFHPFHSLVNRPTTGLLPGCHVHVDNLLTVCWQIQFQIRQACNKVVNMVVVCLYADNLVTNLLQLADRFNFRTLTDLSQPCDNLAISIWKPERLRYIQFNFFLPSYQLSLGSNE